MVSSDSKQIKALDDRIDVLERAFKAFQRTTESRFSALTDELKGAFKEINRRVPPDVIRRG